MVYVFDDNFLHIFGAEESVFFCFIKEKIQETSGKRICLTYYDISNETGISIYKVREISKMFQRENLIKVEKKGMPIKTYYSFGDNFEYKYR
jgi:hypothetical protein